MEALRLFRRNVELGTPQDVVFDHVVSRGHRAQGLELHGGF